MPAPLQPTPLDPSAAQGGFDISKAYDTLMSGGQVQQPAVPPAPAMPDQAPAPAHSAPAPEPFDFGKALDQISPPPAKNFDIGSAFDKLTGVGNLPVVPIEGKYYLSDENGQPITSKTPEQEQAEFAETQKENLPDTDSNAAIKAAMDNSPKVLPDWVPGATAINGITRAIEGGKEAIVQGLTKAGVLTSKQDQDRTRRDLNGLEQMSAGPIPEMDLFGAAAQGDQAALRAAANGAKEVAPDVKVTQVMPQQAEAVADDLAAKAKTPEEADATKATVMGHYWQSQDAAVDHTTKAISMQEVLDAPKPITQPIMTVDQQAKTVTAGIRILQERGIKPNSLAPQTVQEIVGGLIRSNQITPHEIFLSAQDAGMTPNEWADAFMQSGTDASHMLLVRRQFWDNLRQRALMGDEDAKGLIDASSGNEELRSLYQRMTADWKMALVANMSVAMRNLFDGTIYAGMGALSRGLDVGINKIARMINPELKTYTTWAPFADFNNLYNPFAMSRARQQVGALAGAFPQITKDLGVSAAWRASQVAPGATAMSPGILGTGLRLLTAGHQLQEGILRRAVFAASLDRKLATIGSSMADIIKTGDIPKGFNGMMRDSIHDALDAAWSLDLQTHGGTMMQNAISSVLHGMSTFPGVGPLFEAFPRYLYTQIQHVLDYQPLGILKLVSPTEREALARGEPNMISKAVVGGGMFATALAARNGLIPGVTPGENWDEFKIGNQTVSVKAFGTLAPYLYLGDLYNRWKTGRIQQGYLSIPHVLEGLVGNNPLSQVSNLDVFNRALEMLARVRYADYSKVLGEAGSELAGLFNPLRQVFDFASEWEDSLRYKRTAAGQGFTGATRQLTAPTTLPTKPNPTGAGPEKMAEFHPFGIDLTGGAAHQLTGAQFNEAKSPMQSEMDRLGFTNEVINPHLGVYNPRATALIDQNLGPIVEKYGTLLVNSPLYQNAPDTVKAALIHDFYHGGTFIKGPGAVQMAEALAMKQAPETFANIKLQTIIPVDDQHAVDTLMQGRLSRLYQTTKQRSEKELTGLGR